MRPFLLTTTGIAVGLSAVLPLAHSQLTAAGPGTPGGTLAPGVVLSTSAPAPAGTGVVPGAGSAPGTTTGTAAAPAATVTGPVVSTRYGPVQVQLVLTGSRITSASAVALPTGDRRSRRISSDAGPQLIAETLAAQSVQVDTVSGASYTSDGYRSSLQAALDLARSQGLQVTGS